MAGGPAKHPRQNHKSLNGNGHSPHPWRVPHSNGRKPHREREHIHAEDTFKTVISKYILELKQRMDLDAPACLRCNYAAGVTTYCDVCARERTMTGEVEQVAPLWHTGPRSDGWELSAALMDLKE